MPRGFSGMGDLVRQAQKMQQRLSEVQQGLKDRIVEGTSGGNMVRVLVNGKQEIVAVKIDPSVVDPGDVPMLEDLVLAAARAGLKKAHDLAHDEMGKVTGGVPVPGMF